MTTMPPRTKPSCRDEELLASSRIDNHRPDKPERHQPHEEGPIEPLATAAVQGD